MTASTTDATSLDRVRTQMEKSDDTKVVRTRQAIVNAVETLVAQRNSAVTVTDIVRTAGISRSAFYTHFASIDELAISVLRATFVDIGASDLTHRDDMTVTPSATSRDTLRRVTEHLLNHRALYLSVLGLPRSSRAHDAAVDILTEHTRNTIDALPDRPDEIDPSDAARFIAGGTLALLVSWMRLEERPPVDDMVSRLIVLMPTWGR